MYDATHLVHLLQLRTNGRKPSHELIQPDLPQIVIALLRRIPLVRDSFHIRRPIQELGFAFLPFFQDGQVRTGFRELFFQLDDLGIEEIFINGTKLVG